ncbi:unnamed protein product, partial [Amoebophrya sp. A25]
DFGLIIDFPSTTTMNAIGSTKQKVLAESVPRKTVLQLTTEGKPGDKATICVEVRTITTTDDDHTITEETVHSRSRVYLLIY